MKCSDMVLEVKWWAGICLAACWAASAQGQTQQSGDVSHAEHVLPSVTVKARPGSEVTLQKSRGLLERQAASTDATDLLRGVPGASLYGAGGLSALPVLRGLADDRLRIRVNGMDLQSACPNHMNSPLSYIAPADVGSVTVQAGVTSVSTGGDSLGGSIDVRAVPPAFAPADGPAITTAEAGAFFRSNGGVRGASVKAAWASPEWSLQYSGNTAQARNVRAARAFKPETPGTEGGAPLPGDEIASTAYHFLNHEVSGAWQAAGHLVRLSAGEQRVFFEGYPNQRMDMTHNRNHNVNLRYEGELGWADLHARLSTQRTRHAMDMGPDRYRSGTGMPMLTRADTDSGEVGLTVPHGEHDTYKVGAEFLRYTLYDWWPPVGGSMGPNAFWNIDNGRRNRLGAYAEWARHWSDAWQSRLGVRRERVEADASPVQGYNNGMLATWGSEAAAFNARSHRHVDQNLDLSAQLTHAWDELSTLELGYARKTRSPNLYQRYPWSTQAMAALMNNLVGDGNGYIGNEDLRPEVARTWSLSGVWRSVMPQAWQLRANAYVTHIDDYIDARRCDFGQCSADNVTTRDGFVLLQYANQSARIEGMDVSGRVLLGRDEAWGRFDLQGVLNLLRGHNTRTGEPLYNMMPANATFSLTQQIQGWTHTLEWQAVAGKHRVSAVRNEMTTPGYSLVHLRSSREWKQLRLDMGIDNLFNRFYRQPLGGAYVGQGASMSTGTIPWGQAVPGPGRSVSLSLTLRH